MKPHKQEHSTTDMIAAIEGNLSAMIPIVGKMGRFTVNEPPGVNRAIVDIPYALFNGIVDARLKPGQVETALQSIVADARQRQVPVLWWTSPSTRPTDLEKQLEQFGFRLQDDAPGMAVELTDLDEELMTVPDLSIHRVQDEPSRRLWSETMALGFEIPPQVDFIRRAWTDLLERVNAETVLAYIGYLDNQPVATSLLSLGGGAAGIYGVSTIPAARRKGIGAWMTLHPLLHARDQGYEIGVLQASGMGVSVYQSLGFQEYCRVRSYQFRP